MFRELLESLQEKIFTDISINEVVKESLSKEDKAQIDKVLANPDMRPSELDGSVAGWIKRLSLHGDVEVEHEDPEFKSKRKISTKDFIEKVNSKRLLKLLGKWTWNLSSATKLLWYRDYLGADRKQFREKFTIVWKLKPQVNN